MSTVVQFSKMVMKRKSEFELRTTRRRHKKPIVKSTYVLLIVESTIRVFQILDVFKFVFAAVLSPSHRRSASLPRTKSILLFHFNVSKRKSDFEYCSGNMS